MLGHYAELDPFDSRSDVEALMASFGQKGVPVTTHFYLGAKHWFAEPSWPEYDRAAAELAWRRTIEFLRMNVR
jgi:carboxymethylenebutenolidase